MSVVKDAKEAVTNRLVLVVATAIATSVGTALATAYPAIWRAVCGA